MRNYDTIWTLGAANALSIEPDDGHKTSARAGKYRQVMGSTSPYYENPSTIGGYTQKSMTVRGGQDVRKW